jgi:hypothetical protein
MLKLTSYDRMRRYITALSGQTLTDTKTQKQMIVNWIYAASKQIEGFLQRHLAIDSYIEYFDTKTEKDVKFNVKAYPIIILTDVYIDGSGLWDGGESEVTDCFAGCDNASIVIPSSPAVLGYKTMRIRYTGGMAYYGTKSVFTISDSSGTWTSGSFVYGAASEAVGKIISLSGTSLTIEILYGIFEAGETLTEYSDEDLTTVGDASAILSSIYRQSLVEQYPDIVRACEIQTRHYWKHKDDFEVSSTQKDGTNQRFNSGKKYGLLDEAINMLMPYQNKASFI